MTTAILEEEKQAGSWEYVLKGMFMTGWLRAAVGRDQDWKQR